MNDEDLDVHELLREAGVDAKSLPADVLQALKAGRIGAAELSNWKIVLGNPLTRALSSVAFLRSKLIASPRMANVIAIECLVCSATGVMSETKTRGAAFFNELDFFIANQVIGILTNMALVVILTPAAQIVAPSTGALAVASRSLPSYFLQKGPFSTAQRAACILKVGCLFGCIGALTSSIGQAVSLGLVKARTALNPENPPTVELAPPLETSMAYSTFLMTTTNLRYQLVNGFEASFLPLLPGGPALREGTSFCLRTFNNYVGWCHWLFMAKFFGLQ